MIFKSWKTTRKSKKWNAKGLEFIPLICFCFIFYFFVEINSIHLVHLSCVCVFLHLLCTLLSIGNYTISTFLSRIIFHSFTLIPSLCWYDICFRLLHLLLHVADDYFFHLFSFAAHFFLLVYLSFYLFCILFNQESTH